MYYIYNSALMCQWKQQMHICYAGSVEQLTGHLVPMPIITISNIPGTLCQCQS